MVNMDIVLGLGFGDEGKGNVVAYLVSQTEKPLVVRFNGGHQAGHTVVLKDGRKHVHSSTGSGTMIGVPTYISKYCTIDPLALQAEIEVLKKLGITPEIYIDAETMLTTPWDRKANLISEKHTKHGTVGVGFSKTIIRNNNGVTLYARDLEYPDILSERLNGIKTYYVAKVPASDETPEDFYGLKWLTAAMDMLRYVTVVDGLEGVTYKWKNIVFEGAQGIMLDQKYGFFPNVTYSNTTSENVWKILDKAYPGAQQSYFKYTTFYVTRSYQTRHGAGAMTSPVPLMLSDDKIKDETNVDTGIQGKFRRGKLNVDTLKYAISCDKYHSKSDLSRIDILVVTCLDQVEFDVPDLAKRLGFNNYLKSHTPNLANECNND